MRKFFLLFFIPFLCAEVLKAQYCVPSTNFGCSIDYIDNFSTTGGITNITNNGTGCGNYTDYSPSMIHTALAGTLVNFSFTTDGDDEATDIWVDFNQNMVFDPTERVYNGVVVPPGTTITGSFTIPITAVPGMTKLRIRCNYNAPVPDPCSPTSYGETEDYGFMVISPTPCAGVPTAGTPSFMSGCPNSYLRITGATLASGLTYQWQKRIGCQGPWTNINNATSPNYFISSQTQPTFYRMYLICNNSGQSDTSTSILVSSLTPCYCTSKGSYSYYESITNVMLNNVSNATTCNNATYSNFTSLAPIKLSKGQVTPLSINITNCDPTYTGYNNYGVAMFIDFNRDGTYAVNERVYGSGLNNFLPASGNANYPANFVVPATADVGITGMRVILNAYGSAGTSINGCDLPYYGETEDYLVEIEYLPTVVGDGLHCTSEGSFTMSVSAPGMTGEYTYLWTFPDGSQHTDSVLTLPAVAGPGGPSGTYTVVVLSHPCGGGTPDTSGVKTVTVYVQQTPPPPVVAPLITYCQGSTPDTIAIHGQNIKWYSVDTGGTAVTTQPVINTGTPGSFTYYVSQTYGGCESSRVPVTVQVVPQAPPPAVTSPVTYCQNDPAAPLQAVGQNLLWYSTNTGGVGTPVVPTPSTLAQGTFYWYVTQTIDGCESVRVPVEIQVNYRPNALINGSRTFVCQGDTLSFTYYGNADGDPNVTFNWQWPAGATVLSGSGQGPYILRFDSAGAHTISLIVDNNGCVSPEARFSIEVRPLPVFSLEIPEQACQGEIVHLVINQATPGIDSFMWTLDGGQKVYASETAGPYGVRWDQPGQKTITVTGTDRTCTAAPFQDVINIRWLPDASISTPQGAEVCAGDSILLEAVYHPEYTYQWLPEQFFAENNSYRQWARIDYAREITLKVTDVYNCKSTSSIWVSPKNCCTIAFPSAFTPNSDGRNDVFRPITQGHQKITRFVVKNRWGQEVFETADDRLGWDGRFGGTPQDMGVYFYYIKFQCSDGNFYEEKGEVMLVR